MIHICEELHRHFCLILILYLICKTSAYCGLLGTPHHVALHEKVCQIRTLVYFSMSRTSVGDPGCVFLACKWHVITACWEMANKNNYPS